MEKRRILSGWQKLYKEKRVPIEVAAEVVKSGDNVFLPNEYLGVMPYALVARKDELRDVTVEICTAFFDPGWLQAGMEESFNVVMRCYLHLARAGHDEGRIPFIPVTNGTWLKPYRDNRPMSRDIDVAMLVVTPPDENGFCYFAGGIWENRYFARRAKTVIAEVDSFFVKSYGNTAIHVSEIDYLVDTTTPPLTTEEIEAVADVLPPEKREKARKSLAAIHNAVKVDLTGQITCESQFGPRLINGPGGQIEFHIGAFMSEGGKAVTMLPSTYGNGAISNIAPHFEEGTLVTLSRFWADYVVTEYGVASLSGKTHRERAEALIRVAHPDFRDGLTAAAKNIC